MIHSFQLRIKFIYSFVFKIKNSINQIAMNNGLEPMSSNDNENNKPKAGFDVHLKNYVLLAETTTGDSLVDLIKQVLESPSVYFFGELLDVNSVKSLQFGEYQQYWRLLNIFAYGTYKDYCRQKIIEEKENSTGQNKLPDLTIPMVAKLRHLSVVSLARGCRHIPYQTLIEELNLINTRELEKLIIEIIYANVIKGTLDQRNQRLEIDQTIGRDVQPDQDFDIINKVLNEWCHACDNVLSNIEQQIQSANIFKEESLAAKQALDLKIMTIRKNLKQSDVNQAGGIAGNGVQDVIDQPMTEMLNNVRELSGSGGEKGTTKRVSSNRTFRIPSYKNPGLKSWRKEN